MTDDVKHKQVLSASTIRRPPQSYKISLKKSMGTTLGLFLVTSMSLSALLGKNQTYCADVAQKAGGSKVSACYIIMTHFI